MNFDPADPIGSVFADLIGKPAWLVQRGYGSFITLEFGEPHLTVTMIEKRNRRLATVTGDWHLWIYCCDWKISRGGERIARSSSREESITKGVAELDGQILTGVEVDPLTAASRFSFDLGGVLETKRWKNEKDSFEQWLLYGPDGNVLTLRDDARYSWHQAREAPGTETWRRLPGV